MNQIPDDNDSIGDLSDIKSISSLTVGDDNIFDIDSDKEELLEYYRDNIIGIDKVFQTQFGKKRVIYCDWTASGKQLKCIETYINNQVMPFYANTHTTTSVTGVQTTKFRNDARDIIMKSCGCNKNKDVAIFCGNGVTGAINKLLGIFKRRNNYNPKKSICIIGPYEHNSNILIWKEAGMKLIQLKEAKGGGLDKILLEKYLKRISQMGNKFNLKICSFCAVSNVSGIIEDIDNISDLCHKYGFYCCWDYASAAPYLDIDFNNKDAVYISTHKFLGGPNTPGILLAKKHLFKNDIPAVPGKYETL